MSGTPQRRKQVLDERKRRIDETEPIYSDDREVNWNGNSLAVGLTSFGVDMHDITDESTLTVAVFDDGIWIDTGGKCDE